MRKFRVYFLSVLVAIPLILASSAYDSYRSFSHQRTVDQIVSQTTFNADVSKVINWVNRKIGSSDWVDRCLAFVATDGRK